MSVAALASVPAGTVVRLSIKLPGRSPREGDGFTWTAPRPMSVEAARREISADLVKQFMETFLPVD